MDSTQVSVPENWAPRFFTIWVGQAFSLFGSSIVQFALIWYLTQTTGSATVLATATLVGLLPQIFLGPFSGTLIDRWDRRLVMIFADGGIAVVTLVLAYLFWMGKVQTWEIYVALFLRSIGGTFHFPAMQASTSLMVPKNQLSRVAGMNQTLQGFVTIVAPPSGALLIGWLPTQGVLMVDVVTAMMAITPLLFFQIPQPIRQETHGQKSGYWHDLGEGLRYMLSWPGLLAVLLIATALNFLVNPVGSLIPLLVTQYFKKGALALGSLNSLWGFGMIVGGLILSMWGGFKRKIVTMLSGMAGSSIGILIVALAPANAFWVALAGFFFAGFCITIANGPAFALLQSIVRPDMQGRVMSLVLSIIVAMSPISLMVAGPLADAYGIRLWFWIAGVLCFVVAISGFFIPSVMNIEASHNEGNAPSVSAAAQDTDSSAFNLLK
jgi:MFS transporter, DHA3 family, macrolide efflux protein